MKKFFTASFLLFSLLLPFSEAFASNSETEKSGGVSVRLTLSRIENSPEISAKISFSIPKGIHIYGKNPGGGGLPTKITWKLPKGASVSEGKWPEPQIFEFMGVKSLVPAA